MALMLRAAVTGRVGSGGAVAGGTVVSVAVAAGPGGTLTAIEEFSGGVRGEFEVDLPAVLGIQAAEKPPRYVPVAKVRAAMREKKISPLEKTLEEGETPPGPEVLTLAKPAEAGLAAPARFKTVDLAVINAQAGGDAKSAQTQAAGRILKLVFHLQHIQE